MTTVPTASAGAPAAQGVGRQHTKQSCYRALYDGADKSSIPGLDGLRAISVSLVIIAHSGFGNIVPGGLGVTVFFIISGFLITNLLISEWENTQALSIRNFYVRRYLRLTPELYIYLIAVAVAGLLLSNINWMDVLAPAFYFANYAKIFRWTSGEGIFPVDHFWSLAIEEHFYIVMPAVYFLVRKKPYRFLILAAACIAVIPFYRVYAFEHFAIGRISYDNSVYTYVATESRIDSLLIGCSLAILSRYYNGAFAPFVRKYGLFLFAAAAAIMLWSLYVRDIEFRSTYRYSLQNIAIVMFMATLYFATLGKPLIRILEIPPLRFMGRISYGMYIWHLAPAHALRLQGDYLGHGKYVSFLLNTVIVFAFSIAVAWLSERYALRPFQALRRRFGSVGH